VRYFFILLLFITCNIFAAGGQLLNSTFFPNPSEIAKINKFELISGNLFFVPTLTFNGSSHGKTGSAYSSVYDPIPYLYTNYRIDDKWVVGLNMIPSVYGDLSWPVDSVVSNGAIMSDVLFYRSGVLTSYQITQDLALGIGINIERLFSQITFIDKTVGFQRSKSSGYDYVTDFGLNYKLTSKDLISLAYYTPIYKFVRGLSNASGIKNYNFTALRVDASVLFMDYQHTVNDYWKLKGAVYFSKWSVVKKIILYNNVSGDIILPAYWKNVWTFLLTSKHNITDKSIFTWQLFYETNPASSARYNYVGFPLSSALSFSAGCEYNFYKNFYVNIIGSYGTFAPNARINNASSYGTIAANLYTGVLEGSWRF